MDDTLLFIPPCCVDKKLPKALLQAPQRTLTFYTHGDITMERFYRAVSYLLIDPHVLVVCIPSFSVETAAFLLQCFDRKWITHLVITTKSSSSAVFAKYLSEYKEYILYMCSKDVSSSTSFMVLYNKARALILKGNMLERPTTALEGYTCQFFPDYSHFSKSLDWGNPIRNILFPYILRHRQKAAKYKCKISSGPLRRFLDCNFPPFGNDEDDDSRRLDHYSFTNI